MAYKHHVVSMLLGIAVMYWLVYPEVPAFDEYPAGEARKQAFFAYFLPLIREQNEEIQAKRRQISEWYGERDNLGWWSALQLESLAEEYRIEAFDVAADEDWQRLLQRVDIVPPSLALAQAANESGWGTSRFAQEGYNFFGQWCFVPGCGMVPKQRGAEMSHEVAVFASPRESVTSYMRNLNTHEIYQPLREVRAQLRSQSQLLDGITLVRGLGQYSSRGHGYVEEIQVMIKQNDLTRFDHEG